MVSAVSLAGQEAPSVATTPVDTVTPARTGAAPRLGATSIKQRSRHTSAFSRGIWWGRCRCASSTRGGRAWPQYKMKAGLIAAAGACELFSLSASSIFPLFFPLCGVSQSLECIRNKGGGQWCVRVLNVESVTVKYIICPMWPSFISVQVAFSCDVSLHIWRKQKYIIYVTNTWHFEIMQWYFLFNCSSSSELICLQFCR